MKAPISFKKWLIIGILVEIIIFITSYISNHELPEVFKYAARYSGRLSFLVYLVCFYLFAVNYSHFFNGYKHEIKKLITIFCVLHFIHFVFLATNIYLNHIELVPYRLAGGFLGYLLILLYPLFITNAKLPKITHFIYFYYVGFIMLMTYISRIKGSFQGSNPEFFHYFGLITTCLAFVGFGVILFRKK